METVILVTVCAALAVGMAMLVWCLRQKRRELLNRQEALTKESQTKDSGVRDAAL